MNLTDLRPQYGRALLSREISESMLVYYIEVLTSEKAPYRRFRICHWNKQLILQDNLLTMVRKCYLFNYCSTIITLLKGMCFQKKDKKKTSMSPILSQWSHVYAHFFKQQYVWFCCREQGHLPPRLMGLRYETAIGRRRLFFHGTPTPTPCELSFTASIH